MLVYLVGCVSGTKKDIRKYYFGYTSDIHIADKYYDMLVDKYNDYLGNDDKYIETYFIEKVSQNKFSEIAEAYAHAGFGSIEELQATTDGKTILTDSEFEEYSTIVGELYSTVTNEMDTLKNIVDTIVAYSKYDERKDFKKLAKLLRRTVRVIDKEYFTDYDTAFDSIDWEKVQRKN